MVQLKSLPTEYIWYIRDYIQKTNRPAELGDPKWRKSKSLRLFQPSCPFKRKCQEKKSSDTVSFRSVLEGQRISCACCDQTFESIEGRLILYGLKDFKNYFESPLSEIRTSEISEFRKFVHCVKRFCKAISNPNASKPPPLERNPQGSDVMSMTNESIDLACSKYLKICLLSYDQSCCEYETAKEVLDDSEMASFALFYSNSARIQENNVRLKMGLPEDVIKVAQKMKAMVKDGDFTAVSERLASFKLRNDSFKEKFEDPSSILNVYTGEYEILDIVDCSTEDFEFITSRLLNAYSRVSVARARIAKGKGIKGPSLLNLEAALYSNSVFRQALTMFEYVS